MLDYFALIILCLSVTAIFYIFIFIHDLPHHIAKKRNHPQVEAIHYACWLSLFTLHAIWPLVFLWAVSSRGVVSVKVVDSLDSADPQILDLQTRIAELEKEIRKITIRGSQNA